MKRFPATFAVWLVLLLAVGCSGSGSSSGDSARQRFKSRTDVDLPAGVTNCQFKWVKVGDSYGEYYRFDCTAALATQLVKQLEIDSYGSSNSTPNDPAWWLPPPSSSTVHQKEGYSDIANGSRMSFWYNTDEKAAFLKVSFWD